MGSIPHGAGWYPAACGMQPARRGMRPARRGMARFHLKQAPVTWQLPPKPMPNPWPPHFDDPAVRWDAGWTWMSAAEAAAITKEPLINSNGANGPFCGARAAVFQ